MFLRRLIPLLLFVGAVAVFAQAVIAAPPVVNKYIYGALTVQPDVALRNSANANQISMTPVAPFVDLVTTPDNLRTANYLQDISVVNLDTTSYVCIKAVAYGVTPLAGNFDCLGTNPGVIVPPGGSRSIRFVGTLKVWIVANAASTDVQVERALYAAAGAP